MTSTTTGTMIFSVGGVQSFFIRGNPLYTAPASRGFAVEHGYASEFYRRNNVATNGIVAFLSDHGTTGDVQLLIYNNGDVASDTGVYTVISDERIKSNIKPLKGASQILESFYPQTFSKWGKFLEDGTIRRRKQVYKDFGYIAQHIPEIFVRDYGTHFSVAEMKIIPYLHAGWHDHESRIAAIEASLH